MNQASSPEPRNHGPLYYARRLGFALRLGTSPWRTLPDFLIIGAQKAGTTFLYKYLTQHPQILSASRKEVRFFDLNYHAGEYWYRSHFPLRRTVSTRRRFRHKCITGESSPYYLFDPQAPRRAQVLLPQARLIALLRDPVARAISGYHEAVNAGHETLPMQEAMHTEEERIRGEAEKAASDPHYISPALRHFSYKARGIYLPQIERWHGCFSADRLLVIKSEELFDSEEDVWPRICNFLGVAEWMPPKTMRVNAKQYPPCDETTRDELQAFFRPHNRRLFEYLGVDWDWGY